MTFRRVLVAADTKRWLGAPAHPSRPPGGSRFGWGGRAVLAVVASCPRARHGHAGEIVSRYGFESSRSVSGRSPQPRTAPRASSPCEVQAVFRPQPRTTIHPTVALRGSVVPGASGNDPASRRPAPPPSQSGPGTGGTARDRAPAARDGSQGQNGTPSFEARVPTDDTPTVRRVPRWRDNWPPARFRSRPAGRPGAASLRRSRARSRVWTGRKARS